MIDVAHQRYKAAERAVAYLRAGGSIMLLERHDRRAAAVMKAQVAGAATASHDALVDWREQSEALVAPTCFASFFDVLRRDAVPGEFFTRYGVALTWPSVGARPEGAAGMLSKFEAGRRELKERSVTGIMVVTKEMLRHSNIVGLTERLLPTSIALATDQAFVPELIAAMPSINASGGTTDDIAYDLGAALGNIAYGAGSSLQLAMGVAAARRLSLLRTTMDEPVYPALSPLGGMMQHMTVSVIEALGEDVLVVDATGLIMASGLVSIDTSSNASIEMADNPTNAITDQASPPQPVETTHIATFQAGAVALRATRSFDWTPLRGAFGCRIAGAGVLWGAPDTSPPAWSPPD